ncbi:hypothetical protein BC938DRAFT_473881 [Jimgerdemannia flammicorona]|uniref:Uncharacterized protein n=1 Tax=Jimgerdemannia flammicorona TaxID=994334 RepID=A0A433QSY4_9FUNG|nr:hypothetical protein BC938DRAFT_473881 [Jimgerdemannia flammicorona]
MSVSSEPKLVVAKYFKFQCDPKARGIDGFFKTVPASKWSLEAYINHNLEQSGDDLDFDQLFAIFTESLDQINQLIAVPVSIRSVCSNYLSWLQTLTGKGAVEICRGFFEAKILLRRKTSMKAVVEETVNVTAHTEAYQSHLQSLVHVNEAFPEFPQYAPRTPPNLQGDLTLLMKTPNKRPLEDEQVQQYSHDATVVFASEMTEELKAKIGEDLAKEISSVRGKNPAVWTPALEKYIDNALKACDDFKQAIQIKAPDVGDELFRLYCEKVLIDFFNLVDVCSTMSRKIGERKYIIYHIASLFKFYETTFMTLNFDWVESHAHAAKMAKSSTTSGIVLVDAKATRNSDGLMYGTWKSLGPPRTQLSVIHWMTPKKPSEWTF